MKWCGLESYWKLLEWPVLITDGDSRTSPLADADPAVKI